MSYALKEDQLSDEEVFFGKLSLKEIKKHIVWNNHRNMKYTSASFKDDFEDIKIIETHSAPDLIQRDQDALKSEVKPVSSTSLSPCGPDTYSDWEVKPENDSFLKAEQIVAQFCVTPQKVVKKEELNNTLDIIDYILKNGAPESTETSSKKFNQPNQIEGTHMDPITATDPNKQHTNFLQSKTSRDVKIKPAKNLIPNSLNYLTPSKCEMMSPKCDRFKTPSTDSKHKTPIFKTPANPFSAKKPSITSLKKTPLKNNAYQHIASPVASYIKNCPFAPLVKEVRPTKPLSGTSSIPKFVKNLTLHKPSNKENFDLPSVAYKSAKKTQVIDIPDEARLPQTQLMKKITSTLPKPLILKHNHREINLAKRLMSSRCEDSFADLPLRQADVSVCTQKSAFNKPKKAL